jgi:hypothetical protein
VRNGKPTPRQELIGRAALVVAGLLLLIPAILLTKFVVVVIREAPDAVSFISLVIIGAAFLYLVAISFILLAFVSTHDLRRGPPRGFATLSVVFDGFWAIVQKIFFGGL